MFRTFTLCVLALVAATPGVRAEVVPINLTLFPVPGTNSLELTASIPTLNASESDQAQLSGNVLATLGIEFDPITAEVSDLNAVEFTGGSIVFSNTSFFFDLGLLGTLTATGQGIQGTLDTLAPPGTIAGGLFDTSEHVLVLNQGSIDASATGFAGTLLGGPVQVDLAQNNVPAAIAGPPGQLAVQLVSLIGNVATYEAALTVPIDFSTQIYDSPQVDLLGQGIVFAAGQFSRITPIPLPATLPLLAVSMALVAALRRSRRGAKGQKMGAV